MNSSEIFRLALGLTEPWTITNVEILTGDDSVKALHIHLSFKRGSKFKDEAGEKCSTHDTQEKTWRHLNFFEHTCLLHCSVPRIRTSEGKVSLVDAPWARKIVALPCFLKPLSMALIEKEMPVNKVGQLLKENPHRIWTIFNHWIKLAYQADDPSPVTQLGFDETSRRKGHKYVTVAVDLEQRRVIHVVEGKDAKTIEEIKDYLVLKKVEPKQITQASIRGCCRLIAPP